MVGHDRYKLGLRLYCYDGMVRHYLIFAGVLLNHVKAPGRLVCLPIKNREKLTQVRYPF